MTTQVNDIAIDDAVASALSDGTHVVYSLSGGKDSSAAAFVVDAYLDRIGHPRDRRHAIHADLGMIEWPSTSGFVETIATMLAVDLSVVRRKAGGLVQRWEQPKEFARRYENLETYQLVPPFSSARLRFCTGETKVQPIGANLRKRFAGETVISVVGIRREESIVRSKAPISKPDTRFAPIGNRAGTTMLTWHPIAGMTSCARPAIRPSSCTPMVRSTRSTRSPPIRPPRDQRRAGNPPRIRDQGARLQHRSARTGESR